MKQAVSAPEAPPRLAVILATCNRPKSARRAAQSILACTYPRFHLIIVDQSRDRETELQIGSLGEDSRVVYAAHQGTGLSAGRNFGARIAQQLGADWLAFTDDDCEVREDWLTAIYHAVAFDPEIGLLFGAALASTYDRSEGMIPAYQPPRFRVVKGITNKCRIDGIGASMALRADAWRRLGGFDELLGAGAPLRSAEETDLTVRALLAGYKVCEAPDAVVVHHGFRSWPECPELIAGYMYGIGAAMMKMVRLGGGKALQPLSRLAWRWAAGRPRVDLNHQPPRLARLAAFLRGWKAAARMPLTPQGIFATTGQPAPAAELAEAADYAGIGDALSFPLKRKGPGRQERDAEIPQRLGANS